MMLMPDISCDLCADTGPLILRGRCHPTAPLRVDIDNNVLTLRCYIPDCDRLVAQFKVTEFQNPEVANA